MTQRPNSDFKNKDQFRVKFGMDALFLNHYDRELAYLRELGGEFASQYPKIAGRLGMDEFACSDPFVERLLEGFAFMAARVQRRLDSEFPQLTRGLLDTIFPHYTRPVPSAAIFQFVPDVDSSSLLSGYQIPEGTRLYAQVAPGQQTPCRFDTTSACQLWPIRITETEFFTRESAVGYPLPREFHSQGMRTGLRFTIESLGGALLKDIQLDRLRLHLRGGVVSQSLYETLISHTRLVAVGAGTGNSRWTMLPNNAIQPHGFDEEDSLLPREPRSFSGYRLLQDYFLLPEKFLFVDLSGLRAALQHVEGKQCKVVIGCDSFNSSLVGRVSNEHLATHCVPGVNLFKRRADRIHLDHPRSEHHLVVDRSRPLDYEVWSVETATGHKKSGDREVPYLPLYAPPEFDAERQRHATYFTLDRRERTVSPTADRRRTHYPGTEVFIAITDSHQEPFRQQVQQMSSIVYCTNRDLALLPPEGGWREAFRAEAGGPIQAVLCISGPTPPAGPLVRDDGETAWRLVSHLTPNYLSLQDNASGGAAMLREMLQLYCSSDDLNSQRQIEGLLSIQTKPVVRRLPIAGPITHGHGIQIQLQCDEDAFEGGSVFLLGSVLEHFFARYATINSFTELMLSSVKRGRVHSWPPRIGTTPSL